MNEQKEPEWGDLSAGKSKPELDQPRLTEIMRSKYKESREIFSRKRPCILVCGNKENGKTSLIKTIFDDIVPEDRSRCRSSKTLDFDLYENENIRIWDSKGLRPGNAVEFLKRTAWFIESYQMFSNEEDPVHLVWYVFQGLDTGLTDYDLELTREIFPADKVIAVISKRDLIRPKQLEAKKRILMQNGIPEDRIIAVSDAERGAIGCRRLFDLSCEMIPEECKAAFWDAQRIDTEYQIRSVIDKDPIARKTILGASAVAAGIGAIPIPLSDATLLLPTQMGMIATLAALYHIQKEVIGNFALPFVSQCAGIVTATSLAKLIPGIGSIVNAGVAGSLTAAMGFFVKKNFEDIAIKKIKKEPVPEFGLNFEQFKAFYEDFRKNSGKENP
ncbi:MAG: hypothetical protein Q4G69_05340 [Planctomycetia bacterium]|nr:hypothetical protein [Planctomycetia bacterium]